MGASYTKTIGVMQPYFLPYMGYYQLLAKSDIFVVYDNIQYTKKGWINRNRLLDNQGAIQPFVLPLESASDYLDVVERNISESYDASKLLRQFTAAYKKAPFFNDFFPVLESIVKFEDLNLFRFVFNSVQQVVAYLGIETVLVVSSGIPVDLSLRGAERVKATCKALDGQQYLNPIGGMELYDFEDFKKSGLSLKFLKSKLSPYPQQGTTFVAGLSIVDALMNLDKSEVHHMLLNDFELIGVSE